MAGVSRLRYRNGNHSCVRIKQETPTEVRVSAGFALKQCGGEALAVLKQIEQRIEVLGPW